MSTYPIAIGLLVVSLAGCSRHEVGETAPRSWESLAKGYVVEGSYPVFGRDRYVRKTEESADGRLFDFVLALREAC